MDIRVFRQSEKGLVIETRTRQMPTEAQPGSIAGKGSIVSNSLGLGQEGIIRAPVGTRSTWTWSYAKSCLYKICQSRNKEHVHPPG